MPYDPQVAIPTLTGSILSCIATSCVLVSYVVYADQQRSFRHALVLNLALAEFINSLNNSISGIYAISHRGVIERGTSCTVNGWVGQWSVQAADFSILAIAIMTLLTITRKTYMPNESLSKKVLICASVWVVPTITSSTAAGLDELTPVSGNWCWISGKQTDLRYLLGHGWRFAIIFATIAIYGYIWFYMRSHFSQLSAVSRTYVTASDDDEREVRSGQEEAIEMRSESRPLSLRDIQVEYCFEVTESKEESNVSQGAGLDMSKDLSSDRSIEHDGDTTSIPRSTVPESALVPQGPPTKGKRRSIIKPKIFSCSTTTSVIEGPRRQKRNRTRHVEREIKKMLLLNAYPILYVALWLPGIINRIVEATGHSSKALAILQSSTQYVGLANALTYGFNEHMRERIRVDFRSWFRR